MHTISLLIIISLLASQSFVFYQPRSALHTPEKQTPHLMTYPQLISPGNAILDQCSQTTGTVQDVSMNSEIYQAQVIFSIYLPPCYDIKAAIHYPVLYLLHGQTYDNHQWIRLGLADVTDELINSQKIAPLIIVLPNDPDWRQPDESPFGRMLVTEMVPFIDQNYPTRSERQYRAIGGLSRGASWAFHLGLTEWHLFSRIGAHSLPVFAYDNAYISNWLEAIPTGSYPQIYIDMGNQDPELNIARQVESTLTARHIPHEWHMFSGAHEENYWGRHLEKYLIWYACEWAVLYYN
jgi:enterochelin esterase-like enzyme